MEDLYKGLENEVILVKSGLFQARSPCLGSVRQINSLVLTRLFQIDWLKVIFLGKAETVVRLGVKY